MTVGEIEDVARRLYTCLARHDPRELARLELALRDHPRAERDEVERRLNDLMGIRPHPPGTTG